MLENYSVGHEIKFDFPYRHIIEELRFKAQCEICRAWMSKGQKVVRYKIKASKSVEMTECFKCYMERGE